MGVVEIRIWCKEILNATQNLLFTTHAKSISHFTFHSLSLFRNPSMASKHTDPEGKATKVSKMHFQNSNKKTDGLYKLIEDKKNNLIKNVVVVGTPT